MQSSISKKINTSNFCNLDFSKLWQKVERRINKADCLNGISISEDPNILYFTG